MDKSRYDVQCMQYFDMYQVTCASAFNSVNILMEK